MAAATPRAQDKFAADLRAALQVSASANTSKTESGRSKIFGVWSLFCQSLGVNHSLSDVVSQEAKLTYLIVFGLRYSREGQKDKSVRADTVTDALLAVGQGISHLGRPDPRKETPGAIRNHPLLASFLKGLRNKDDPSKRSYPANIAIIRQLYTTLELKDKVYGTINNSVINLIIIAFYWLLRPAEYTLSRDAGRSQAFLLQDAVIFVGNRVYYATDPSLNDVNINKVTAAALTFTDQKNGVRGEQVTQKATSDPHICPAKALFRLAAHLREHEAPSNTPLCAYYDSKRKLSYVKSTFITNALRHAATDMHHLTGIEPSLLSARSLRPGGATALLCAGIDKDVIQLLGRWKSDAMFRYLRIQAHVYAANLAQKMLDHGSYTFAPGTFTEASDMPLPQETPAAFINVLQHTELFDED